MVSVCERFGFARTEFCLAISDKQRFEVVLDGIEAEEKAEKEKQKAQKKGKGQKTKTKKNINNKKQKKK